jgi:hypothetical protein
MKPSSYIQSFDAILLLNSAGFAIPLQPRSALLGLG